LVLIENKKWWFWFMDNLHDAFDMLQRESDKYVFISDRDKGLDPAIKQRFPHVKQSFCCQHLCDNIVAAYGVKCKALFWPIARAKTKQAFESALAELRACNTLAADYLNNIQHNQ
jgi:transposase-like protein